MIKKYITLAALLSAGTALVNAAESEYRFTTTFQKNVSQGNVTWKANTTLEDTSNSFVQTISTSSNTITIKDRNGSSSEKDILRSTGDACTSSSFIPINVALTGGGYWELTIPSVSMGWLKDSELQIKKVDLYLGAFQRDGNYAGDWITGDGSVNCNFSISMGSVVSETKSGTVLGVGHKTQTSGGALVPTGQGTGPMEGPVTLNFDGSNFILSPIASTDIKLKVSDANQNFSVGIQKVVVYADYYYPTVPDPEPIVPTPTPTPPTPSDPNLPEPSAFGLLAGLGALALVSARRRRK